MSITTKEFLAIQETDFLLTKASVIPKIQNLMEATRKQLIQCVHSSKYSFPQEIDLATGKISRGENYLNLPYLVLDYPAIFTNQNIFAYRTMFWWGNFFSSTLHLAGESLENCRGKLLNNLNELTENAIYICIGKSPWHYHYGRDNYQSLTKDHNDFIGKCNFLKLSVKMDLKDWKSLPEFSADFFKLLLSCI